MTQKNPLETIKKAEADASSQLSSTKQKIAGKLQAAEQAGQQAYDNVLEDLSSEAKKIETTAEDQLAAEKKKLELAAQADIKKLQEQAKIQISDAVDFVVNLIKNS